MTNDCIIRRLTAADLDAIIELWKEFMDFHRKRDGHFARSTDGHEKCKEYIANQVSSDTSCVFVAEGHGEIIGYCLATLAKHPPVFEKRDYGSVVDLAVTERYRSQGIGQKLYEAVQTWFLERGIHRIELRVAVTNEASTAFWRKMGFEPYIEILFKNL